MDSVWVGESVPGRTNLGMLIAGGLAQATLLAVCWFVPAPAYPIGFSLLLLFAVLCFIDLRAFLIAVPFLTFAFPADWIQGEFVVRFLGMNWYAMDWLLLFAALAYFSRKDFRPVVPERQYLIEKPLIYFLLALPVWVLIGGMQGNQLKDAFADGRLFFYYASYFLVVRIVKSPRDARIILWSAIICGVLEALPEIVLSLSQTYNDPFTQTTLPFRRITGAHEVNYPLLVVLSAGIIPFLRVQWERVLAAVALVVSTIALFLSYTRGSWVAAVAGLLAVFAALPLAGVSITRYLKTTFLALIVVSVALTIIDLAGIFTWHTLLSRASVSATRSIDVSSLQRLTEWVIALGQVYVHPVQGAGLGFMYRFTALGVGFREQLFLHNSYMYVLSKMGIVGFLLFMAVLMTSLRVAIRTFRRRPSRETLLVAVPAFGMLVTLMAKSITTWHLNTLTTSLFVGCIFALIESAHQWDGALPANRSDGVA